MAQASRSYSSAGKAAGAGRTLDAAYDYGRNGEPLPDIHIYASLTALDEAYMSELHGLRARQEVLEQEIVGLAKRLAAPLEDEHPKTGGFWGRFRRSSAKKQA